MTCIAAPARRVLQMLCVRCHNISLTTLKKIEAHLDEGTPLKCVACGKSSEFNIIKLLKPL
jgi:transcription elongation factor Elf1